MLYVILCIILLNEGVRDCGRPALSFTFTLLTSSLCFLKRSFTSVEEVTLRSVHPQQGISEKAIVGSPRNSLCASSPIREEACRLWRPRHPLVWRHHRAEPCVCDRRISKSVGWSALNLAASFNVPKRSNPAEPGTSCFGFALMKGSVCPAAVRTETALPRIRSRPFPVSRDVFRAF